jgi:hypothetical protein
MLILTKVFKITLALAISTLVMADAVLPSCSGRDRGDQAYQPDYPSQDIVSYEQLQQDLSDINDGICFPDLSHYDGLNLRYEVIYDEDAYNYSGTGEKVGYSLGNNYYDYYVDEYQTIASNSLITAFNFSCAPESYYLEQGSIPEGSYRGIPYKYEANGYFDYMDGSDLQYGLPYEYGFYYVVCDFLVDGYYYFINVTVRFSPEDYSAMSIADANENLEKAEAEVMAIIDSVLDQKGLPKDTMPDHNPPSRRNPQPADSGSTADAAAPTTSG